MYRQFCKFQPSTHFSHTFTYFPTMGQGVVTTSSNLQALSLFKPFTSQNYLLMTLCHWSHLYTRQPSINPKVEAPLFLHETIKKGWCLPSPRATMTLCFFHVLGFYMWHRAMCGHIACSSLPPSVLSLCVVVKPLGSCR